MNLGPMEIGLIILAVLLLFGYKKLPDASRSMGRSMRIFKSEMKGMKDDDRAADVPPITPVQGQIAAPAAAFAPSSTVDYGAADREAEARAAELRAAELRARADRDRASTPVDGTR
ncbi:sec-independent protein translocase protein TatA [Modestobacter sp. DSM 44400]|uniref:Sec-independent protein translocase subunit TatA n=1 Tax=Modestobacter sp. DSM 44400 TaxID=1550230 RepID=UPI00089D473F|nr:Sec-independent protein translocase subunit TatA [Modestobacter sp. DSM 44400]SDY21264.1 sec-independent protein translocase protein TatA [Modestobacter sp. DSM 44400]